MINVHLAEERVGPFREGLLLGGFSFVLKLLNPSLFETGVVGLSRHRMWDMSDCTCMASGDRRFLDNFFDLNFISITFERKSKVLEVFLDISLVR